MDNEFITKLKQMVRCFFGKHVWQRPPFIRLNILPGEEDFNCCFCGKHKTFYNRKKPIRLNNKDKKTDVPCSLNELIERTKDHDKDCLCGACHIVRRETGDTYVPIRKSFPRRTTCG